MAENSYRDDRRPAQASQQRQAMNPSGPQVDGSTPYDPIEVGKNLVARLKDERQLRDFTTSQLRKVLSSAVVVKNRIDRENSENDILSKSIQDEIQYIRVKLIYQMGREPRVKSCLSQFGVDMPGILKNIGTSKEKFDNFYRLLESIVAYRKFEGE